MTEWIRAANEENELDQWAVVEIKIIQSHIMITIWGGRNRGPQQFDEDTASKKFSMLILPRLSRMAAVPF